MIVDDMSKRLLYFLIGLLFLVVIVGPESTTAQSSVDDRFGMTEVFWLPEEAQELGVGWERILFYWREIQPTGPDDWNTLHVREEWLTEANAQDRTVVGLIKNTAPWASTDGTEAGVPEGLYLPLDDPGNLWANYVRRLAEYYSRFNVHHWIIWNEPEIEPGVYGFEYAGTTADYYQLLKSAYKVIKESDPDAVIHLAGLTWWHDPTFLERLLALAAADPESAENDFFFDVISLHIYFRSETVRSLVEEVNTIQGRYGLEKPIWINETNAPPNRDPDWPVDRPRFTIDLEQQAWFIVQAMALGFASGAERIGVYKLIDIHLPPGGESFGVVRPDYSRRPAFDAFKLTTRCFGGFTDVFLEERPEYYHVTFERPDELIHVAWARTATDTSVRIPATSETAAMVSIDHSVSSVLADEGSYVLQLPGQRCDVECLVGGEPLVLVEGVGEQKHVSECLNIGISAEEPDPSSDLAANSMPEPGVTEAVISLATTATVIPPSVTGDGGGPVATRQVTAEVVEEGGQDEPETAVVDVTVSVDSTEDDEPVSITLEEGENDQGSETIGLWFLGAGALVALGITLTWKRHNTSDVSRRVNHD
jgi:hypothetical protein